MGYRLSKITTKTGDKGQTGLGDGSRVSKTSARIMAIGDVDELNATIGFLVTLVDDEQIGTHLKQIQNDLFDLGSMLAVPGYSVMDSSYIEALEQWAESIHQQIEPLQEFILPGGATASAYCHFCRTVCRRAERQVLQVDVDELLSLPIQYLNRLSDVLFILARVLNKHAGVVDVLWQKSSPKK